MPDFRSISTRWTLWVAQGFGLGRIPMAPGTFGSLGGILWTAALLLPGSRWLYGAATLAGLAGSVWICAEAERILGRKDPGSVVLDEITAIPICFLPWVCLGWGPTGSPVPTAIELLRAWQGGYCLLAFALFRLFDIWKPWPIRQSQRLPGGWGITVDDSLAAVYVALVLTFAIGNSPR